MTADAKMNGMELFMELIGRALTLSDLVSYQDGSVVSKTLIDKKIGTLTMFSFGAGQGLSEHTAPFDAVVQVVDGEAEVIINGDPQTVSAGQMIIMPANIPHELKAVKPFKMLLTMIRA
jgi:quercetin dioxygenase-like cupin family protein